MYLQLFNLIAIFSSVLVNAAVVEYDWSVGWTLQNPDGRLLRPVIAINGQWPNPEVRATVGDTVRVVARNDLGNETLSFHWHGLFQKGTNAMDGPMQVTQCPILPGQSYTYEFQIQQTGTYWYHSHAQGQYGDGLRGALIIEDPNPPYHWDDEQVLILGDHYHDQMPTLIPQFLSAKDNPSGAEPIPYSALLNEGQTTSFNMSPGKTYYFRIINVATFSQIFLNFDHHNMTIIEVDGVYTEPREVESLWLATAQRYGVLITAKDDSTCNYAFTATLDVDAFDHATDYLRTNATGQLTYDASKPQAPKYEVDAWRVIDDFTLVPQDKMPLLAGTPDQTIHLDLNFTTIAKQNRATWNDLTYISPKVPTLASVISASSEWSGNSKIYGTNTNPFVLQHGNLIEIAIHNYDGGMHPLHMHGHHVQLVYRKGNLFGPAYGDVLVPAKQKKRSISAAVQAREATIDYPAIPMRRDTWTIAPNGETRLRFIANNPGVWLLHCHMDWHVEAGLTVTMIEAPDQIQEEKRFLPQIASLCQANGIPTEGNAVGNTDNWEDLTGEVTVPPINNGALLVGTEGAR